MERAQDRPRFLVRSDAPDLHAKAAATKAPMSARLAPTVAHEAERDARRAEIAMAAKSTLAATIQSRPRVAPASAGSSGTRPLYHVQELVSRATTTWQPAVARLCCAP